MAFVGAHGRIDLGFIEAVMREKSLILAGNNGRIKKGRNFFLAKIRMRPRNFFSGKKMTHHLADHHRTHRRIYKSQDRNLKNGNRGEYDGNAPYPF
jgi:hypothetical protein